VERQLRISAPIITTRLCLLRRECEGVARHVDNSTTFYTGLAEWAHSRAEAEDAPRLGAVAFRTCGIGISLQCAIWSKQRYDSSGAMDLPQLSLAGREASIQIPC
jgi:hypothetical protein